MPPLAASDPTASCLRIEPPLGIPQALLGEMLTRLEETFREIAKDG